MALLPEKPGSSGQAWPFSQTALPAGDLAGLSKEA
jgi:hypothetical protein